MAREMVDKQGRQIGRGANGMILEAKWEGAVVAVKQIHSIFVNEVSEQEFQVFKRSFLRECEQSSRLRHPNIVRFFGIYHPPGAKVPGLVMERLHCSLSNLLEQNPVLPIETKQSIIHDVSLGLRYLHTRTPIIIHRDLSSNNVFTKGMEGKIGDLGTARLVDPRRQSQMTKVPGTVDFMPPEALAAGENIKYERELDVFSFGCVMLHTLSQQWPTPSEPVITDPVTFKMIARSEIERRSSYFNKIDNKSSVLILIIKSCLSNIPKNRASIVQICTQLEELVDKQHSATDRTDFLLSALQQEIKKKDAEIQDKDIQIQNKDDKIQHQATQIRNKDGQIQCQAIEIEALKSNLAKLHLQVTSDDHNPVPPKMGLLSRQVNKSSIDFWNNLKPTWQCCADLPIKCWITSVAELDENVYVAINSDIDDTHNHTPLMYDSKKDQWSKLPKLPYTRFSLVAIPDRKQLLAIGGVLFKSFFANSISNKVFLWDEQDEKWSTLYPNMPTARYDASSIYHGSTCTVIAAGGRTNNYGMTGAVEVLHIREHSLFSKSYWSVVKQLPHIVCEVVPHIYDNNLYIAVGFDEEEKSTCNIETAFIPELLKSNNKNTNKSQVWKKLPDMPYSSFSINHIQGHLITFTGDYKKPGQFGK